MLWAYVQIELKEKYLKLWSMKVYMMAIGNHLCSTHCLKQEKWTAREKGKGKRKGGAGRKGSGENLFY